MAKCRNCGGPHLSQANVCPEKRRVWQRARGGGRLPYHVGSGGLRCQARSPHPRRQRGGEEMLDGEEMAALHGVELGGEVMEE